MLGIILYILLNLSQTASGQSLEKWHVLGYLERAMLVEANLEIEAKLDTGADNSSINATEINFFEKAGKEWVRFKIEGSDGRSAILEREVIRTATIKQSVGKSKRPVVELKLCVGNFSETVAVNLVDRSHLQYPLLIGRSFLRKGILVDSAAKFTAPPICRKEHNIFR